ncbi:MAG: site-specific integrase, partial [Actinobacteria bacterium]|nr:site-specific integrase [Actinomycetota bacterium]
HGEHLLGELDADDLAELVAEAGRRARRRRPGCTGRSAEENCVAALRALYRRAVKAKVVACNPAAEVDKPQRLQNRRRALSASELAELWEALTCLSRDPELDLLLVRFHLETGARRAGAIGLCLGDVDPCRQTVWLHEKFDKEREQPVSANLLHALFSHAESRGARDPEDPVFRYRTVDPGTGAGRPLTRRHYNTVFEQLQRALGWAERMGLCAHVLRHTAGTAVERPGGHAVAIAFLGHAQSGRATTGIYTKASIHEVAAAVALLTGEPHPLAPEARGRAWCTTSP